MDLNWTDAQWISFFEKAGPSISLYHHLYELYTILRSKKVWVYTANDIDNDFAQWNLSGVVLGNNTNSNGIIWVSIANIYGGNTVSLYRDSGKHYSDMVAQGTGVGLYPQTIVLSETNSSGLSGTVLLDSALVSSDIYLVICQGLLAQIDNLDQEDDFDARYLADLQSVMAPIASDILNGIDRMRSVVSTYFLSRFGSEKMETAENGVVFPDDSQSTAGVVEIEDDGVFKYLLDAMADNTPNPQRLKDNNVGFEDVPVQDVNNVGEAVFTALDPRQNMRNGRITFECTGATFGSEQFSASTMTERGIRLEAANDLVVEQTFRDSVLGLNDFTIGRAVTEVADPDGKFSNYMVTGADDDNTTSGHIYLRYVHATTEINAYSDAARTLVVANVAGVVGAATYTLTEQNDSGLTVQLDYAGGLGANSDFEISVLAFAIGDKVYIETGNSWAGYLSTFFARNLRFEFLVDSALFTIPDGIGNRGFGPGFGVLPIATSFVPPWP